MLLTDLLSPDRVRVPLAARSKREVIEELTGLLVAQAGGDFADVLTAVLEREEVLSTGIGHGVAIPHGKSPTVAELNMVCGMTADPVPFESIDGEPARLFFLVVGPEGSTGQHVKILSRIARLVHHEAVRARLLRSRTAAELYAALADAEAR